MLNLPCLEQLLAHNGHSVINCRKNGVNGLGQPASWVDDDDEYFLIPYHESGAVLSALRVLNYLIFSILQLR